MNYKLTRPLMLEQLEERIFLDANPLAVVADSMAGHAEPMDTATPEHVDTGASAGQRTDAATPPEHADETPDNTADAKAQASADSAAAPEAPAQSVTEATEATEHDAAHPTETQEQTTRPTAGQTSGETTTADAPDYLSGNTTPAPEAVTATSTAAEAYDQVADTGVHTAKTLAVESPVAAEASRQDTASADEHLATDTITDSTIAQQATAATSTETETVLPEPETSATEITQVVFVDNAVDEHEILLNGILQGSAPADGDSGHDTTGVTPANTRIVVLDAAGDEVQQISDILAQHDNLAGVHILSHGSENSLKLGGTTLDTTNLDQYADRVAAWGRALSADGDLLLYGCNIADSSTENSFIQAMATLTGADVAASNDPTGNVAHGGDWELEVSTGLIETKVLHDASDRWEGLLEPPLPTASVSMPAESLIEENISFTVAFDNAAAQGDATNIGYGPYLDVYIPVGLRVQGAPTYAGTPVNVEQFTWNGTAWVNGPTIIDPTDTTARHPFDTANSGDRQIPLKSGTIVGDVWYLIELPFGSFTPEQPAAVISFTAEIDEDARAGSDTLSDGSNYAPGDAVVGTPLTVTAQAGFRYGTDALDNPNTDQAIVGSEATASVTPTVMTITKISDAPENQTATGPNFPVTYIVTVDIAPDQEIENLVLFDYLPSTAYYRDDCRIEVHGVDVTAIVKGTTGYQQPIAWQYNSPANNDFTLPLGTIIGANTDGQEEIILTYTVYYGPEAIAPCSGNDAYAINEAMATGSYTYPDATEPDGTPLITETITAGNSAGNDGTGILDSDISDHQDELNSITVRKSVINQNPENGLNPGDILTYTITFEISDYFGFENIVVEDVLGDGQTIINTPPTLTTVASFPGAQNVSGTWALSGDPHLAITSNATDGSTTLSFDVSGKLGEFGGTGELYGDLFDGDAGTANTAYIPRPANGTYGTITFQAQVDDDYRAPGTGLDHSVDTNDPIENAVTISASILDPSTADPGGDYSAYTICDPTEDDGSATQLRIGGIAPLKEISHINGVAVPVGANPAVSPGDVVTYRINTTLPRVGIENLILTDYLPLPVFSVDEFGDADFFNSLTIGQAVDPNSYDLTQGGRIYFGTGTDIQLAPNLDFEEGWSETTNTWKPTDANVFSTLAANSLTIDLGTFNSDSGSIARHVEIYITATVQNAPFADGLFLTNQATWSYDNTFQSSTAADEIIQIELATPQLSITKGVIATNNSAGVFSSGSAENLADLSVNSPGSSDSLSFSDGDGDGDAVVSAAEFVANPMNATVTAVDGADLVTFAVTVANSGASAAYGLEVRDTLPGTGFLTPASIDAMNLQVWSGTGTKLTTAAYTAALSGGELLINFDATNGVLDGDRLGAKTDATVGDDLFIITYDLAVDNETAIDTDMAQAGSEHTNTASITYFTGKASDVGTASANWVDPSDPPQDDTIVTIAMPTIAKALVSTEITEPGNAGLDQATIGELVTYTITLTVPEGQMGQSDTIANGTILRDTLDSGLAFVDVLSVSASTGLAFSGPVGTGLPTVATTPANTAITANGQVISFNLGQITNTNTDNDTSETVEITYRAIVLNTQNNQTNQTRTNHLDIDWNNGAGIQDLTDVSADWITIVEPTLATSKLIANTTDGTGFLQTVYADTGDVIQYQITITNGNAATDTTAFDISLADTIPAALTAVQFIAGDAVTSSGDVRLSGASNLPAAFQISGNTLSITPGANIDIGVDSSITITLQGMFNGATGDIVPNTAQVQWTSLDGQVSGERSGDDGLPAAGVLDDYRVESTATISAAPLVYKTIVATSEPSTLNTAATIGELVRYRLYVSIGEGDTNNFQIQDNLPGGLRFLNDDTARWTFIASDPNNMTSGSIAASTAFPAAIDGLGNTAVVVGNGQTLATLASADITGTFNDNNIATAFNGLGTSEATLYASGQDVYFRFGDIQNNDSDADLEFVVVEFNALVENTSGNQAGANLRNNFAVLVDTQPADGSPRDGIPGYVSVTIDNDQSGTRSTGDTPRTATDPDNNAGTGATNTPALSNNATLAIVEPQLAINKTVTATTGSVVTYQVVITNTGTATAFDAAAEDILPADLDLDVGTVAITTSGGATTGTVAHDDVANQMKFTGLDVPVNGSVTITYQATVATLTTGVNTIDNTANLTWTSLPAAEGTAGASGFFGTTAGTIGDSGTASGERNGSGNVNDYRAQDSERLGSMGDRVYLDLDGDGVQDAGEPGLVGVPVTVRWEGPDGKFGNGDDSVITVNTGTDGSWSVAGLPVGAGQDFRVSVPATIGDMSLTDVRDNGGGAAPDPDGLGIGISAVTLSGLDAATSNNRLQDFGYRGTASLGDRVYIDADGDGVQDTNGLEPNLPGVQITLTWAGLDGALGTTDDLTLTTTSGNPAASTDPNYLFQHLPAGDYQVSVSASGGSGGIPGNMNLTDSLDNGTLNPAATITTTLTTGASNQTVDFGYQGDSSIGDTIWYDADGDAVQDTGATSEPGIPGVTVTLAWSGPDGLLGTADDVTFTTTTDANGKYLFSGLPVNGGSDQYRVSVTPPAASPSPTYDSDGIATANQSTLALPPDTDNRSQDFGYRGTATSTAQLGDFVWEDRNGNGVQDPGEPGIDRITVDLYFAGADGVFQSNELLAPLLSTTTSNGGFYVFDNLAAGTYRLRFGNTDGSTTYALTTQNSPMATDVTDSDVSAGNGFSGNYILGLGESNTTVDAGLYRPVSLGDRIYFDYDGDGVQDTGEPGLPNMPVEVIWLGPDGLLGGGDDRTYTTATGTDGTWSIDDLPPGSYLVTATPAPGSGLAVTDSMDNALLDPTSQVTISTVSGADRADIDFGFRGTGSVGDTIWNDRNGNGVQELGEPGIGGVTVTIGVDLNGDGVPDFTTSAISDADGRYLFDHLPAGSHTLRINPTTLPPGMRPNYDPDSTLDNAFTVNLTAEEHNRDVDFGYYYPAPKPPAAVTPIQPVQPPPVPEADGFIADAFFMHRQFGDASRFGLEPWFPFDRWMEITYPQQPLPVSPIYTGIAEPGTTLALAIYDASGNTVGSQTIMADTGGNWLASFPGVLIHSMPHDMKIEQRISLYNESTAGLFNMRTYFNPNCTSLLKTSTTLNIDSIFDYLPSTIMNSVHSSLYSSFNIRWNNFNGYEFFATSINPAETGR